jgi:crotonobetainyl-CoA:carnitine CoA-transferase CaiB-like acyl-CoA transferase
LSARTSHALDDLKVIEYAEMLSGPMCGKMFAGMGAQVIKIESPNGGDPIRRHPHFVGDEPHPEKSGSYLYLNTAKHSLTLDPAAPPAPIFSASSPPMPTSSSRIIRRASWPVSVSVSMPSTN